MKLPAKVKCPKCGYEFSINEVLAQEVNEYLQKQKLFFQKQLESEYEEKAKNLSEKVKRELAEEKNKEIERLKSELEKQFKDQTRVYEAKLEETKRKMHEIQKQEEQLKQMESIIKEKEKLLENQIRLQVEKERENLIKNYNEKFNQKFEQMRAEYEERIRLLNKSLEEAQMRATSASERIRGEVAEINIQNELAKTFSEDQIEEVLKGVTGADIIQKVFFKSVYCGTLVWEVKRTKSFNRDWIKKLKDDVIKSKGNIGILITTTLPEEVREFGFIDGIWICSFDVYIPLAIALRMQLIEQKRIERLYNNRDLKSSELYRYIISDEFRNKIISIVESFRTMREDLEVEKRAMLRIWSKREKEILRMTNSTISIVGDLQGIIGNSFRNIDTLDLDKISEPKIF